MKKKIVGILILLLAFLCAFHFSVNVNAGGLDVSVDLNRGAAIRETPEHQGLMFEASLSAMDDTVTEHGFYIALGIYSKDDIETAINSEEPNLVNGNKLVKKVIPEGDNDTSFRLTIVNFPDTAEAYSNNITVMSYAVVNGVTLLSNAPTTRSILHVARGLKSCGHEADYINAIYNKCIETPHPKELYVNEAWIDNEINENIDGDDSCIFGVNAFLTLQEALSIAMPCDVINVESGTYSLSAGNYQGNLLLASNVTIVGPNATIDPNTDEREDEAILTGIVTLDEGIYNTTIAGLKFTGTSQITVVPKADQTVNTNNIDGFNFDYNIVESALTEGSFLNFVDGNRVYDKDLSFTYNKFTTVDGWAAEGMIKLTNNLCMTYDHNTFDTIDGFAVRTDDTANGVGVGGDLIFTNNIVKSVTGSAVWFNYVGALENDKYMIKLDDNTIIDNGGSACFDNEDANSAKIFASYSISGNTFTNGYKCVWTDKVATTDGMLHFNNNTITNCSGYYAKGSGILIDASMNAYYNDEGTERVSVSTLDGKFNTAVVNTYSPIEVTSSEIKVGGDASLLYTNAVATDSGAAQIVSATVADETIATIDGETLNGVMIGETTLTVIAAAFPEDITVEITVKVVDPAELAIHVYVDPALAGTEDGTTVTAAGVSDLVYGETAVATISESLALIGPYSTITLAAGDYDEDFTIVVNNILIEGPNSGTEGYATRVAEANIQGVISIASGVTGLTIDGIEGSDDFRLRDVDGASGIKDLTMTNCLIDGITTGGSANVFIVGEAANPNENFVFSNNYMVKDPAVEDNTTGAVYYPEGDIYVGNLNGLTLDSNIFDGAYNIVNFSATVGGVITMTNNQFKDFQQFGLRLADFSCTQLDITNNYFYAPKTQDLSSFVGAMRLYDAFSGTEKCTVNIKYNKFEEVYGWYPLDLDLSDATVDTMEINVEYNEFRGDKHTGSVISVMRNRLVAAEIINMGYNCFLNTDGSDGTDTYIVAGKINAVTATGADFADEAALIAALPEGATFSTIIAVAE